MSASDGSPRSPRAFRPEPGRDGTLRPDEPMSDETCVFVLSLHADGRPVPPELLVRARAWAEDHPACRAMLGDFGAMSRALRALPVPRASARFAEGVLAARAAAGAAPADILTLARRMAVAAALLLGLTIVFDTSHPRSAMADPDVAAEPHAVDVFRAAPFADDDVDAALEALLPDPARRASHRSADDDEG